MLFDREQHAGLRDGSITMTFRRWSRPQARAGGRYRLDAAGVMEVDSVDIVRARDVSDDEARLSGFRDLATLMAFLRARRALAPGDAIYRVTFRYVSAPDERDALAKRDSLTPEDVAAIVARLDRMDASSTHGPWTRAALRLIEAHPHTLSTRLASKFGRERLSFKADVRKLKALGLTISHEVGYELSPRGRAVLARLAASRRKT